MNKIFSFVLLLLFLLLTDSLLSQPKLNVQASLNNTLRYGSGLENRSGQEFSKEYFEDLADARIKVNDFVLGFRYEISDPIEYGLNFKGIRKRYLEYSNLTEGISVRAGDFWDIVGRGLTLNLFENRPLVYDTGIDGVRVSLKRSFGEKNPIKIKAQIIAGNIDYNDFLNFQRKEKYKLRDGNFEISPLKFLTLGTNYIYSTGEILSNDLTTTTDIEAYLPEGYINFIFSEFQFFASYAHKHVNTKPSFLYPVPLNAKGDGFYASVSYSKPKIGVTLDYKNYRFDITTPDNQATDRPTKMLPFQNPPTALKEHVSTLISRNPHVVDFNDEVGGQLDILYSPNDKLSFNINLAIASKHYEYVDSDSTSKIIYTRVDRKTDFIPSLDDSFSPFWEVYVESEYYVTDNFYFRIGVSKQSSVLYNQLVPSASEKIFYTTIPTEFRYSITKDYTLKLNAEHQWGHNSIRHTDKNFMSDYFALTLSRSPNLSVTGNIEFTTDEEDPSGKKFWALGEVAYKITPKHTLTVSYGSERGGLKCTSGICRYVNPFNGFRLTVSSIF